METVTPETVGLASNRLARISRAMQGFVEDGILPGAVAVVARRGKIAYAECFGWMDIEAEKPMRLDAIFNIGSMTKPITSVGVMMLYEEGHFQLYDPISKFIPEFKETQVYVKTTEAGMEVADAERAITIHDLLRHTSGLIGGLIWEDGPLVKPYWEAVHPSNTTLREVVQKLAKLPLSHQPGAAWRYSESYEVLGYLVELVSGVPFPAYLRQRVFEPLGMVDTGFSIPSEQRDRVAKRYALSEPGEFEDAHPDRWKAPEPLPRGGFRLSSTASDFGRFAQMLLNGGELGGTRLLGRKTVEWMTQNHLPAGFSCLQMTPDFAFNGHGYGLGFRVLKDTVQFEAMGSEAEYGWYSGSGPYFWVDPREELIGLLMPQIDISSYFRRYPLEGTFVVINPFRVLTYQAIVD
jgi:CubicO group peptidase (beta-lactamase class C family)